jgi:serine/threonine-protein kinase
VKLAVALLTIGFVIDPVLLLISRVVTFLSGQPSQEPSVEALPLLVNLSAIALSAVVWGVARSPRVSQTALVDVGLIYEVVICLVISLDTHYYFLVHGGELPHLTWVVAIIILFPLILPSPPRRALLAALVAALTSPLSLLILEFAGGFDVSSDQYLHASLNPALAVVFATFASRVIYGLNADVVRARRMGSYQLVERLGRGGMGEVWRAKHRLLARPAAIKLIPPDMLAADGKESPEVTLRRFEREAQATASLCSPHTIQLHDFGTADDGTFYYVMELLDGLDLEDLVENFGPIPAGRTIFLLRQVCQSLAEAHQAQLIHRDIKPANIFVCRYGLEHDFVKVLDFGLVKSREESEADLQLTAANVAGGTPAFMAPEQALGRAEVDARADLYALGCVAFWLLTGRMVFSSDRPLEMLTHHLHTAADPPSAHTELPVPPALDRIVLRCLEKSPDDRPGSADELARALAGIEVHEPWLPETAATWWSVHRPPSPKR